MSKAKYVPRRGDVIRLDWRERKAEFVCTPGAELLEEVIEKAFALLSPDEDDL